MKHAVFGYDICRNAALNEAGGKGRIRHGKTIIALLDLREPIGNLTYEHNQARGIFDRIDPVGDIAGVGLSAVHRAAEAMRTLVGNDGLHGSGLADHASRRADGIFLQIAYQAAYAEAADLLVITQRVMQRRIESILVQRRHKFWCLSECDADEALHIYIAR